MDKIKEKVINDGLNVKKTEELINKELLKISSEELKKKRKNTKNVLPAKLYVNTIKQVFEKFDIPAEYGYKDEEEFLELTIKIPKPKK